MTDANHGVGPPVPRARIPTIQSRILQQETSCKSHNISAAIAEHLLNCICHPLPAAPVTLSFLQAIEPRSLRPGMIAGEHGRLTAATVNKVNSDSQREPAWPVLLECVCPCMARPLWQLFAFVRHCIIAESGRSESRYSANTNVIRAPVLPCQWCPWSSDPLCVGRWRTWV